MIPHFTNFESAISHQLDQLARYGEFVDAGTWQGVPTAGKPDLMSLELIDVAFRTAIPHSLDELRTEIKPSLPWADDHFEERVSRNPSNPGSEYKNWPWWQGQESATMTARDVMEIEKQFTHTYQERFWPLSAWLDNHAAHHPSFARTERMGIRYDYGDLDDVVGLLVRSPFSRQAYLPIFFPEDTGAVHGGRIPCTLGYHFLLRNGRLNLWYDIRSCDAVRHFRDDLYLAARLALWVLSEIATRSEADVWRDARPGLMTFHAHSFHVHKGDLPQL